MNALAQPAPLAAEGGRRARMFDSVRFRISQPALRAEPEAAMKIGRLAACRTEPAVPAFRTLVLLRRAAFEIENRPPAGRTFELTDTSKEHKCVIWDNAVFRKFALNLRRGIDGRFRSMSASRPETPSSHGSGAGQPNASRMEDEASTTELPTCECPACKSTSVKIGGSNANDARRSWEGTHMETCVRVAQKHGYDSHDVFLCRTCGLLFVSPILTDGQTMNALFREQAPPIPSKEWKKATDFNDAASVFNTAVRCARYDQLLEPFLDKSPVRVLDVGAHGGEISLYLDLAKGSSVDLLQMEGGEAVHGKPRHDVRIFTGMLKDLTPGYSASLILALHVLEHVDDPCGFMHDLKSHLAADGLLLLEVPLATEEAFAVASGQLFQITHNWFFTPESLRHLVAGSGLEIVETCVDPNANTGNGTEIYPVIRMLCKARRLVERDGRSVDAAAAKACFARTVDMLFCNFSGSLAFLTDKRFKVFVYDPRHVAMARVFETAEGFSGLLTSNPDMQYDNVFSSDFGGIDFIFTVCKQDRDALKSNLGTDLVAIQ